MKKIKMVGATGFEPATSCSQSKCSTKLSYAPFLNGAHILLKIVESRNKFI